MRALWPLIVDTWRQSRQQAVFLILLGLLGLIVIGGIVLAQPVESTSEDGEVVERVALLGFDGSEQFLTEAWMPLYSRAIAADYVEDGETPDPFGDEGQELQQKLLELAQSEAEVAPARKCVEVLIYAISFAIYSTAMLLFIAASAGYFPAMLEAGAVDIVLAKPLERWKIFLGKYLGGLALFAAALVGAYCLLFVGLGLRTGVWHPAILRVMPLQLLSAATLYAVVALLGVARGSTGLAMVLGYLYYLVVDKLLGVLTLLPFGGEGWQQTQQVLRWALPNFVEVRNTALISILYAPALEPRPLVVMFAWLLAALGLGYWVFRRRDY